MIRFALIALTSVSMAFAEGATGGSAPAPAPGGAPGGAEGVPPGAGGGSMFLIFFLLMGFMLWSTWRSQKKEKTRQAQMIAGLKIGDDVETIGGLRGTVERVGEGELDIRTGGSDGALMTFASGAVKQLRTADDKKPEK